jgi:hypothetical protein
LERTLMSLLLLYPSHSPLLTHTQLHTRAGFGDQARLRG